MLSLALAAVLLVVIGSESKFIQSNGFKGVNQVHNVQTHGEEFLDGTDFPIPCDISSFGIENAVLILLYKDNDRFPIYSIDSRVSRSFVDAREWSTEAYGGRLHLQLDSVHESVILKQVTLHDQGVYTCRVDFITSPTRRTETRLSVIKPVERLILTLGDEKRRIDSPRLEPLYQGSRISVTCTATGGYPPPEVTWWHGNTLIDGLIESRDNQSVGNTLHLSPLTSYDHHKQLTCKAINSHTHPPLSSTLTLQVKAPKTTVRIIVNQRVVDPTRGPRIVTVAAGTKLRLRCEVLTRKSLLGVVWIKKSPFLNETVVHSNLRLRTASIRSSKRRYLSSPLVFSLSYADDQMAISCQPSKLTSSVQRLEMDIKDIIKLNVLYKPRVLLSLRNSDSDSIKEGEAVYMLCQISGNPPILSLKWLWKGEELELSPKVLLDATKMSLVLHDVTSDSSGEYVCEATNSEGTSRSNAIHLDVFHTPKCLTNETVLIAGNLNGYVNVSCGVHSSPSPTLYTWDYKMTISSSEVSRYRPFPFQTKSRIMKYQITSLKDFTTLLCWASNPVGKMVNPCSLKIVPTGIPEPVFNCKIINNNYNKSVEVRCSPGFDGGSQQSFTLRIWQMVDQGKKVLLDIQNSSSPFFKIPIFEANMILFEVTAWNCDGSSRGVFLPYSSFKPTLQPLTTVKVYFPYDTEITARVATPSTAVILGLVVTLSTCFVFVLCCVIFKCSNGHSLSSNSTTFPSRDDAYHERGKTRAVIEKKTSFDYGDNGYISAGCLLIGVNERKRRKLNSLDKISLLDQLKNEDLCLESENLCSSASQQSSEQDCQDTTMEIENYPCSPKVLRRLLPRMKISSSLSGISSSSCESMSSNGVRPDSKTSITTVIYNPKK